MTTRGLHVRALYALLFAVARYIPVPIVDDLVRDWIGRRVVAGAAATHDVTLEKEELAVLGASPFGCVGCLLLLVAVPIRLVLTLVLPLLALVLGVRWASRDLVEVFALGRTIERILDDERYPRDAPLTTRVAYARDVRRAFDLARQGLDLQAVQGLLSAALGPIRSVIPAAMRALRGVRGGDAETTTATPLEAALDDPRMKALLESIDARFDEQLLALRARSSDA
jgi:hypothetical protein